MNAATYHIYRYDQTEISQFESRRLRMVDERIFNSNNNEERRTKYY